MSLFCRTDGDYGDYDWWWYQPADEKPLATKRSRKCCSCGEKVGVGDTALECGNTPYDEGPFTVPHNV